MPPRQHVLPLLRLVMQHIRIFDLKADCLRAGSRAAQAAGSSEQHGRRPTAWQQEPTKAPHLTDMPRMSQAVQQAARTALEDPHLAGVSQTHQASPSAAEPQAAPGEEDAAAAARRIAFWSPVACRCATTAATSLRLPQILFNLVLIGCQTRSSTCRWEASSCNVTAIDLTSQRCNCATLCSCKRVCHMKLSPTISTLLADVCARNGWTKRSARSPMKESYSSFAAPLFMASHKASCAM